MNGMERFREKFRGFVDQYVIIGGTACDCSFTGKNVKFRVTKDIDLVLLVEELTVEFVKTFWEFVKEAAYQHQNKQTGNVEFYRFSCPADMTYPYMIELFSRNPESVRLADNSILTPLPMEDDISSLSAIVLNESYYALLKKGRIISGDLSYLGVPCLIAFKAKAWLDLRSRKKEGENVDSKSIRKHKNDVLRLAQILDRECRFALNEEAYRDMLIFLEEIEKEETDMKSLGIRSSVADTLTILKRCFAVDEYILPSC